MPHHRCVRKMREHRRDEKDDHDAGKHNAQCGHDPSGDPRFLLSDEGRRIHRNDPRSALTHCVVVHQFLFRGPVAVFHDLPLKDGKHRISAAEGHDADLRERTEQPGKESYTCPLFIHCANFSANS